MTNAIVKCDFCNSEFERRVGHVKYGAKKYKLVFCNRTCSGRYRTRKTSVMKNCVQCGLQIVKRQSEMVTNKTGNFFCTKKCAAKYNNAHKKHGTRRSKLEVWLEAELRKHFPEIGFVFNGKEAINSELDIFIPELKLAFELNGIFHYEPIYGNEKLTSIQSNDQRKFAACHEHNISLCIIDTSQFTYFKVEKAMVFFNIIKEKIDLHISWNG